MQNMIKMKANKSLIGVCIGILLIIGIMGIAIADQTETTQPQQENYNDPAWLNSHLDSADYSKITDWSKVDQSKIPATRIGEVPADKLKYSSLSHGSPDSQAYQMTPDQIAKNLNNIQNLRTDVNPLNAEKAILGTFNAIISLGTGGSAVSMLNNVLKTNIGQVSLSNPAYSQDKGSLSVDDKGNIVFNPKKGSDNLEFPKGDKIMIDTNTQTDPSKPGDYQAVNIRVPGTTTEIEVSGKVDFDKGKFYIMKGDMASVQGYFIDNRMADTDVQLLFDKNQFDSKKYVENAVNFNAGGAMAYAKGLVITTPSGIKIDMTAEASQVTINGIAQGIMGRSMNMDPENVKSLQRLLNDYGLYSSKAESNVDGIFQTMTQQAVMNFQKQLDIPATGIFDEATRKAFLKYYGEEIIVNKGTVTFPEASIFVSDNNIGEPARKGGQSGNFHLESNGNVAVVQIKGSPMISVSKDKGVSYTDYDQNGRINNNDLLAQINDIAQKTGKTKEEIASSVGVDLHELEYHGMSDIAITVFADKVHERNYLPGVVETTGISAEMSGEEAVNMINSLNRLGRRGVSQNLGLDPNDYSGDKRAQSLATYKDLIVGTAQKYDLDPELLDKVIQVESGGNPNDISTSNCIGLMQVSVANAKGGHIEGDLYGDPINPLNPVQNLDRGAAYLAQLLKMYNGNAETALAAYNTGPHSGITSNNYARAIMGKQQWGGEWIKPINNYR